MTLKGYPVALVGESSYQNAVRRCKAREKVELFHEAGNPFDDEAIVAVSKHGEVIGYIARDSWLHRVMFAEKKDLIARIRSVNSVLGGDAGIVLTVKVGEFSGVVPTRRFVETAAAGSPDIATKVETAGDDSPKSKITPIRITIVGVILTVLWHFLSPAFGAQALQRLKTPDPKMCKAFADAAETAYLHSLRVQAEESVWKPRPGEIESYLLSVQTNTNMMVAAGCPALQRPFTRERYFSSYKKCADAAYDEWRRRTFYRRQLSIEEEDALMKPMLDACDIKSWKPDDDLKASQ